MHTKNLNFACNFFLENVYLSSKLVQIPVDRSFKLLTFYLPIGFPTPEDCSYQCDALKVPNALESLWILLNFKKAEIFQ